MFNTCIFQFFSSKPSDPKADDFMDAFHQCRCRGAEGVNAISSATMRNILHLDVEVSWYWKYVGSFLNKTPLYVGLCLRKLNFRWWNVDALGQDLWKYIRSIKPKGNDHNDQHAVWSWSIISNNCDPQKDAWCFISHFRFGILFVKVSAIDFTMVTTNWTETRDMEMIPVGKGTALRPTYQRSKIQPAKCILPLSPIPVASKFCLDRLDRCGMSWCSWLLCRRESQPLVSPTIHSWYSNMLFEFRAYIAWYNMTIAVVEGISSLDF